MGVGSNYYVVSHESLSGLKREVNKMLQRGWRAQGGISVTVGKSGIYLSSSRNVLKENK